jgi:ParB family chromosome partitioning protein
VVNRGLSVRETELLVKKTLASQAGGSKKPALAVDPDIRRLETSLSEKLGANVKIKPGKKGSGQLVIHFHSSAELDGILEHLSS